MTKLEDLRRYEKENWGYCDPLILMDMQSNAISELETELAALPKWTRITDDPATWPPKEVEFLTAWHVSNDWIVDVRCHSDVRRPAPHGRIASDVYWLPITPPTEAEDDAS